MAIAHLQEFEDGKVYSHKRVAAIMDMEIEWVLKRILFPKDRDGIRFPGVSHVLVGSVYFMTGEAIRLWIESQSQPDKGEQ